MKTEFLLMLLLSSLFLMTACSPLYLRYNKHSSNTFSGKYSSFLEPDEKEVYSGFHFVASKNEKEYIVRTFFPETKQITSFTTYKSMMSVNRNGISIKWFDNGFKQSEGNYINGLKDGPWLYFGYDSDYVNEKGEYNLGKKKGNWKVFDDKSRLIEETTYVNGIKEGDFVLYDIMSNIINNGTYKSDTIFFASKPSNESSALYEMPMFFNCDNIEDVKKKNRCSHRRMLEYVYGRIQYPFDARQYGIQGKALVVFTIDKEGHIKDIKVINGLCESISHEIISLIENMPDWYKPGTQNGENVSVRFDLDIMFKLQN